eukprot:TRINITY_DN28151_c0_g1_i1.p2 TRINITY_DN28151_c0_g1~~TRINITY_DN28151_c0_g1_i1.p2  ORF type:complete len:77 (-),score=3.40 TRINITY_DN28151_c0_g1_i1:261-491(-)
MQRLPTLRITSSGAVFRETSLFARSVQMSIGHWYQAGQFVPLSGTYAPTDAELSVYYRRYARNRTRSHKNTRRHGS